jgi:hypothetical protein
LNSELNIAIIPLFSRAEALEMKFSRSVAKAGLAVSDTVRAKAAHNLRIISALLALEQYIFRL